MKTIKVETESGAVNVRKLVLVDYAKLLKSLKVLPEQLSNLVTGEGLPMDNKSAITALLPIIGESLPELASVLALATDKDQDFIMALGLDEVLDILAAALELNNYARVIEAIKKIMGPSKAAQERLDQETDQAPETQKAA